MFWSMALSIALDQPLSSPPNNSPLLYTAYPILQLTTMSTEGTDPATDDFSDASSCSCLHDSIAKRRRQGEYFHRPPVWFLRSDGLDPSTPSPSSDADHTPAWKIEKFGHRGVLSLENHSACGRENYTSDPESTDPKRVTCSDADTEGSKETFTPESTIFAVRNSIPFGSDTL